MLRSDFLDQAKSHVTRDRAATHGKAEDTFAQIAALWSADLGVPIAAIDVARLMALFKIARAKGNPGHADNWVDLAGYAAIGGELGFVPPVAVAERADPPPVVDWEALADQVADTVSETGDSVQDVVDRVAAEHGVDPLRLRHHAGGWATHFAPRHVVDEVIQCPNLAYLARQAVALGGGDEAPLPGAPTDPDPSPAPRPAPVDAVREERDDGAARTPHPSEVPAGEGTASFSPEQDPEGGAPAPPLRCPLQLMQRLKGALIPTAG